ncbi:MAG TPA: sigma-70 family RNA polymerase sigma factor [Polyangia bacterium]
MIHASIPDPLEGLLKDARWLAALARQLAGGDADDLVQETWLAVLRSPPDPGRSARPWLSRVLSNLARRRQRGTGRRQRREQAVFAETSATTEAPDTLYERLDLQRFLAERTAALEEPFRQTVLLRYYEGRSAAEIAKLLEIPAGTVRWRLKEALNRLRADLDQRHGGNRAAWCLLIPTARPRDRFPWLEAALLMVKGKVGAITAGIALITLTAGVIGWRLWRGGGGPDEPSTVVAASESDDRRSRRPPWVLLSPTVTGRVLTHEGIGAAGAVVSLWSVEAGDARGPGRALPTTVKADRQGAFTITGAALGKSWLSAAAHEAGPSRPETLTVENGENPPVTLTLTAPQAVISGRLLDAREGTIPHGWIQVFGMAGSVDSLPALIRTVSDEDGRFSLGLPPGLYSLRAGAAGYAPENISVTLAGKQSRDIRLDPAAKVAGIVRGPDGQPVSDAAVILEPRQAAGQGPVRVRTQADGRFEIGDVRPDQYMVTAQGGELVGQLPHPLDVPRSSTITNIELRLGRGRTISGRVLANTDAPLADVRVGMFRTAPPHLEFATAITGTKGEFVFRGALPGSHMVSAYMKDYADERLQLNVVDQDVSGLVIKLSPGTSIEGTVRRRGVVVAGAEVVVDVVNDALGAPSAKRTTRTTRTDSEGQYNFNALLPGQATIVARHPQGAVTLAPITLAASARRVVDIALEAGTEVSGKVRWSDGKPAAGIVVNAHPVGETGYGMELGRFPVRTGADGTYRITGLASGGIVVSASVPETIFYEESLRTSNRQRLLLEPNEQRVGVDLVMPATNGVIAGVAIDDQGQPVADAAILFGLTSARVWGAATPNQRSRQTKIISDESGHFQVTGLEPGEYTLWGRHTDYAITSVSGIKTGQSDARLVFVRGASVAGAVYSGGKPVPSYTLFVRGTENPSDTFYDRIRRADPAADVTLAVNDPSGRFEVKNLVSGTYDVIARDPAGQSGRLSRIQLRATDRRADLRVVIDEGSMVKGRAVDLENGQPLAGFDVRVIDSDDRINSTTAIDGTFVVRGFVPGTTRRMEISQRTGVYLPERVLVEMADPARPIDLGTVKISRKPSGTSTINSKRGMAAMGFAMKDGRVVVSHAIVGGPAWTAGVRSRDHVLATGNTNASGLTAGMVGFLSAREAGHPLTLTLAAPGGPPRTVTFTLVEQ